MQRDDLRLHRDVEGGGRLVGDHQFRLGRERQRQHDALAHPAGKLMRIVVDTRFRRRDADLREQRDRAGARDAGRHPRVRGDGLDELIADAVERIEAGERVLEHHADALAADAPHGVGRQVVDALAFEQDRAAGDPPRRLQQADDGIAGHRLAGTGLADHAQNLARHDVERHVVDRGQRAAPGRKLDPQVAHAEDGGGHPSRRRLRRLLRMRATYARPSAALMVRSVAKRRVSNHGHVRSALNFPFMMLTAASG